jgi:hypothetical protein
VQLLRKLLFGSDGWHYDGRYPGEVEQVAQGDLLDRAQIVGNDVHVEAQFLELPAGQPRGNRESQAALWPFGPDAFPLADREFEVVREV